jgi:small nuclear ribonucleoprotein E
MNMVVDDAEEVSAKRGDRKRVGRILLKGDAITLMRPAGTAAKE